MTDKASGSVLVVDDDAAVCKVLLGLLKQAGIEARHVQSGEEALSAFSAQPFDVVLTDLRMPGMDGLELLEELKRRDGDVPVIMLTAYGTVSTAVQAMKAGAADFMTKPFERDEVLYTVRKALTSVRRTATEPPRLPTEATLIGGSAAMRECRQRVKKAAASTATVLLLGESGTGKEVAARAIRAQSSRSEGPFVVVNCGALPDQLLESELFGYEKGAFTGATSRKPGRVAIAQGGTLFLDEIGDVSAAVQVKLLRLLENKEYQPLGSNRTEKADVRFVAATHRDLEALIERGEFREDLYYRLSVVPIGMPPLREHLEDVPELATTFCQRFAQEYERGAVRISDAAMQQLDEHDWAGNVRELQNLIERLVVFADGDVIEVTDVDRELRRYPRRQKPPSSTSGPGSGTVAAESEPTPESAGSLAAKRSEAERQAVVDALERANRNRTKAARLLGISRRTLYNRLTEFGLLEPA